MEVFKAKPSSVAAQDWIISSDPGDVQHQQVARVLLANVVKIESWRLSSPIVAADESLDRSLEKLVSALSRYDEKRKRKTQADEAPMEKPLEANPKRPRVSEYLSSL